ncbi:MAG TPA: 2-amino-4-hydroxy-6-hydroxymethyldihydropteridine diphosphokinase [Stellaceae bacterium]
MILIGIGGNLDHPQFGAPRQTLAAALRALEEEGVRILGRSAWYRSQPVPPSDQPWFVNGVAEIDTVLSAAALLAVLQRVEASFGRVRGAPNAARVLDLDLLDHHGALVDTPSLVLPHPRLHRRRFVLAPLAEIAPEWRHPRLGQTAARLLGELGAGQPVARLPC